jgi:three-Cys-motif partner protein
MRSTLWELERHTLAKHTILRKYLDAWLPILGGGARARHDLILVDAFAGPGRYAGGEDGSPLHMIRAYLDHSAAISAQPHFYFIEEDENRATHLASEIDRLALPPFVDVEVIHGSFDPEFPTLINRLRARYGQLPPTFAFIDPFGAGDLPVALASPLLNVPRCEVLVYFPTSFVARFGQQAEFEPIMKSLFSDTRWHCAYEPNVSFEQRKRMLLDLFMAELRKRVPFVRAFEITPTRDAGGNTYHLVFGTANADQGLRKMKDAMWRVDPAGGEGFRDTTLADHPVLFRDEVDVAQLEQMIRERFGTAWFTIEEAERFTLLETPFRDNAHLKGPTLKPAEQRGALEVRRQPGKRSGTFTSGTRMRFRE